MRRLLSALLGAALASGCVMGQPDPSSVVDLRVLGMRFEPPESLVPGCSPQLLAGLALGFDGGLDLDGGLPAINLPGLPGFDGGAVGLDAGALPGGLELADLLPLGLALLRPVDFTALVADPRGEGRELRWKLFACSRVADRACADENGGVELARGTARGPVAEISWNGVLGVQQLADQRLLLQQVLSQDTFVGLGGVRVPVVMEVEAGDDEASRERIFAQKLFVYTCQFFPSMRQNVNPQLGELYSLGRTWGADEVLSVSGPGGLPIEPEDFTSREESYVVPSVAFQPVALTESWRIAWFSTVGSMSPFETGGADFAGQTGRHRGRWNPDTGQSTTRLVTIWLVVRDGRGGQSWVSRRLRWTP